MHMFFFLDSKVRVTKSYKAEDVDELSLREGDIIQVRGKPDSGKYGSLWKDSEYFKISQGYFTVDFLSIRTKCK